MTTTPSSPPAPIAKWPATGLAALSGFLYFLAFPGVDVWPLAFVALVPLIVAMRGQTPRRAAWLGWVAGFVMTMCGFYWLLEMLKTFSGFPIALCLLFMSILCGYQAGRIGLLGWLTGRAQARGYPFMPVFALGMVTSELVFPLLFPWTYAATVHQVPVLLQLAEIGGPFLPTLVLTLVNLAIAEIWLARRDGRAPHRRLLVGSAVTLAATVAYGAVRIPMVDSRVASAEKAEVGVVQANMSLMGKRRNKAEGLRRHLELTNSLKQQGPLDLVVWSETSVVSPQQEEFAPLAYRMQFARALGVPTIFGAVLVRNVSDGRGYVLFNSAMLSDQQGEVVGRYDKQYLLAFGEYLPFGETFPKLYEISRNSGRFTPGKTLEPLRLGSHGIATFICYEDIIPGFVRSIVNSGETDLLVNITNDAWFGDTTEPWIHLALAKLRAIEHRRYLVRSTNSGISAFVDPVGRVLAHTGPFRQEAARQTVAWLRGATVYGAVGNAPWWLIAAVSVGMAFRARPGSRRDAASTPEPEKTKKKRKKRKPAADTETKVGDAE
ncbi:MAG: apolipoprotein N-acyltransferase [Polyangiaceae bacterium]